MKYDEQVVANTDQLFVLLTGLADPTSPSKCRGQALATWRLQPTLDRGGQPGTDYPSRLDEERCMIEQFRRRAENLLGTIEWACISHTGVNNLLTPLTVMQHFGAPTRLLDWTESPFVAAFFACVDRMDQDGALWWFKVRAFEQAAGMQWDRYKMRSFPDEPVDFNRFAFQDDSPPFLGTTYLRLPFHRLEAQQGLFTVAGRLGLYHDDLLSELLSDSDFGKIVVPARVKREAIARLKFMNVTAKSLEHVGADRLGWQMARDRGSR